MSRFQRTAFTLIELLVVIAIIGLLAAILFPVFARARENARRTACLSNIKQIGLGVMQYAADFDEKLPDYKGGATPFYPEQTKSYVGSEQIYRCPNFPKFRTPVLFGDVQYPSYGFNGRASWGLYRTNGWPLARVDQPAITWMLVESQYSATRYLDGWGRVTSTLGADPTYLKPEDCPEFLAAQHLDGSNVGFADGHAKWIKNGQAGLGYLWKGS